MCEIGENRVAAWSQDADRGLHSSAYQVKTVQRKTNLDSQAQDRFLPLLAKSCMLLRSQPQTLHRLQARAQIATSNSTQATSSRSCKRNDLEGGESQPRVGSQRGNIALNGPGTSTLGSLPK